MKRLKIEQSDADIISHSGLSLVGLALQRHTSLAHELDTQVSLRHGIKHPYVMKSYLAMLSIGKNDFEAINTIESEFYFMSAMGIDDLPSEATLRQRMDEHAVVFLPIGYLYSGTELRLIRSF
jgi:hypothetical protein